ncbi:MAG: hypothetical protein ABSC23_10490 [Bryobacteraceae bacterium]|jgi:hypothetical protein
MRLAGFLLMPAGWIIVLAALALLPPGPFRVGFLLAGVSVETLGLIVAVRSHARLHEDER